jgi:hypothetical protein
VLGDAHKKKKIESTKLVMLGIPVIPVIQEVKARGF